MQTHYNSIWQEIKLKRFNLLTKNQSAQVCIVGSGIAGLTVAYELLKSGKSVVILDKEKSLCRETTLTSAHLSNALDDLYINIQKVLGEENAKLAAQSHASAIDKIEEIIRVEKIDCDFSRVDGYLFASDKPGVETVVKELKATHKSGLKETSLIKRLPQLSKKIGPALIFPQQGQFHALKYLKGLFKAVVKMNGCVYGQALVTGYEHQENKKILVKTSQGYTVECDYLVFATNSPSHHRVSLHTKESAYRTYVIGIEIPKDSFPKILLWDTAEPYHYVRVQSEGEHDVLIVGGEDHRVGQGDNDVDYYERLEKWTKRVLGISGDVLYKWSGQIIETLDGLGYIGKSPTHKGENVFEVSGDSGHGLTHGTIAGLIIPTLINQQPHPWQEIYDPARKTYSEVSTYVIENLKTAVQALDWLTPGEVEDEADIPPDSGAILRRGLKKVAAYRDEHGKLHECSAVCPHMGSIVHWNQTEKTWDCPMHGSRFCTKGQVINGPAVVNLEPITPAEEKTKKK
jgi:glycine/D-amino acid oxidase-like deaminating enzyme/nitrite reductase/ring-hydroxylating ferredoxin subunit